MLQDKCPRVLKQFNWRTQQRNLFILVVTKSGPYSKTPLNLLLTPTVSNSNPPQVSRITCAHLSPTSNKRPTHLPLIAILVPIRIPTRPIINPSIRIQHRHMTTPILALIQLKHRPPARIPLHTSTTHLSLGLKPAPHIAGTNRPTSSSLTPRVDVLVWLTQFGVAGADKCVGEVVCAVVGLHVAAGAAVIPVCGDGRDRWGGG